jgi:poly(3-hydroxybutyrate) depolymerase
MLIVFDRLEWWAKRNGCSAENPQVDTFNDIVHWRTWNCSGSSNLLQHYLVDDMGEHAALRPEILLTHLSGHVWPDTEINFSSIADNKGPTYIDASKIMMDFFSRWARYG